MLQIVDVDARKDLTETVDAEAITVVCGSFYFFAAVVVSVADTAVDAATTAAYGSSYFFSAVADVVTVVSSEMTAVDAKC